VPANYKQLREAVNANGGLCKVTMLDLKNIHGAGRLGVHVRDTISRELASHGLAHFPRVLPGNQDEPVRLYLLGTPVADVVSAVLDPSDRGDQTLRDIGTSDAQAKLRLVRELVCE
jgi:hypothetical protein